jgi:hypothetical protein
MRLFNLDLHVSVISDIRNICQQLYREEIEITSWSITGESHKFLLKEAPKPVEIVNEKTWYTLNPNMIAQFVSKYHDFLSTFDGFIVTHTPSFAMLYATFNKPVLIINSCRYDQPFSWSQDGYMWNELNTVLKMLHDKGLLKVVSNNLADKAYIEAGVGIPSSYIPSLCKYTDAHHDSNNPNTSLSFCLYGNRQAFPEHELLVSKPERGYTWADLYKFKGIVHEPYEISTMSIFEQVTAGVPLFFPTKRFYKQCIYDKSLRLISHYAYHVPREDYEVPEPLIPFYESYDIWLDNADYYHTGKYGMKHMYYYDSFEELFEMLEGFEESAETVEARKAWLQERERDVLADWKTELDAFFFTKRAPSLQTCSAEYVSELTGESVYYTLCSVEKKHYMTNLRGYVSTVAEPFVPFECLIDHSFKTAIVKSGLYWIPHPSYAERNTDFQVCLTKEQPPENTLPFINNAYLSELVHHMKDCDVSDIFVGFQVHQDNVTKWEWPIQNPTMNANIHFVSFASNKIYLTLERVLAQANASGYFSTVTGHTELSISSFVQKNTDFFRKNPRLFGYGTWKPYIVHELLERVPDGEFVLYSDSGNSINPLAAERFNDYLQFCRDSPYKNVCMHLEEQPGGKFQEKNWTKEDVLSWFALSEADREAPQICGGFWLLQKCDHTVGLVKQWLELAEKHAMWDDSPSMLPNAESFVEHRHCQSMLSCLLKTHGTHVIEKNEFDVLPDSWNYPVWATRIR